MASLLSQGINGPVLWVPEGLSSKRQSVTRMYIISVTREVVGGPLHPPQRASSRGRTIPPRTHTVGTLLIVLAAGPYSGAGLILEITEI